MPPATVPSRDALHRLLDALQTLIREHLALARVELKHDLRTMGRDLATGAAGVPPLAAGFLLESFGRDATIAFFAIALFGLTLLWQNGLLTKHAATLTIVLLAALLIALRLQRKQFSSAAVFSISLFLVLPLCLAILSPFTLPDQTAQIARALRVLNPEKKPIYVIGTNKLASRLRISSGAAYEIHQAKRKDLLPPTSGSATNPIFILSEGEARRVNANEFQIREVAAYPIQVSLRDLVLKTLRGESKSYIESKCKRCYAAVAKRS